LQTIIHRKHDDGLTPAGATRLPETARVGDEQGKENEHTERGNPSVAGHQTAEAAAGAMRSL